jgi:UDPglucose 6-dehydrogenase
MAAANGDGGRDLRCRTDPLRRSPVAFGAMSRIAIVGTGYVGLTTGACFAHLGHDVICADVDADKVARLSRGEIPIVEHGLDRLVEEGIRSGRLSFVLGAANAVKDCEIAFLCVPTPQGEDGSADLSYIESAAKEISPHLPYESVVVNKSTVPVGSARVVERVLDRPDVKVVSNPEFLREGSAVQDFLKPDRIVVGSTDQSAAIKVSSLYLGVAAPVIVTDPASAETIKYAANAFLATKLSFVNAVAAICEGVGADVNDVVLGLGYDKRIGQDFLRPGPGWGGSCFPKDTRALLKIADDAGYSFDMLQGVVAVNDEQFERVTQKVVDAAGGDVAGKAIGVWGLTFKARTDDLRESPSIAIIERLLERGATVKGHDPTVAGPKPGLPAAIEVCADPYDVADGADVLVVLTEWEDYRWLDAGRVATAMKGRAVVDSRNLLDRNEYRRAGFTYAGIGR